MGTGKGQTINRGTKMISAIITCAGNHSRFGKNKLLADLGGKPVFIRTLEQFSQAKSIDEIIVVIRQSDYKTYKKAIQIYLPILRYNSLISKCRVLWVLKQWEIS